MLAALAEGLELVEQRAGIRDEPGIVRDLDDLQVVGCRAAMRPDRLQQRLDVQHADDVVRIALVQRQPGERAVHHLLRSEEHTSELQSLMRISYAVFCLQKKTKTYTNQHVQYTHKYHA